MKYLLQLRRYRLPLAVAVRTAHGVLTERAGVIVRLEDETGRVSFGEAAPVPGFGSETAEESEAALRGLVSEGDGVVGAWVSQERIGEFLVAAGEPAGARIAVGSALAELSGKGGQIAHDTAGATERLSQPREVALSDSPLVLPVAALLPAGREAGKKIRALSEAGFRTFKWKVGVAALADELGWLDDVCAELPPGARLRLDANGAWDRRAAERWLERCAERPVEFVEQPCAARVGGTATDKSALRREEDLLRGLAEDWPTAIALDESLVGEGDVERWLAAEWRGVWVVKPSLLGGAALARLYAADAEVVFSSALETAVGARAALRVAFAWDAKKEKGVRSQETGGGQRPTSNVEPSTAKGRAEVVAHKPRRALGFGVWPLFADARFDGPYLAPFLSGAEVERINVEAAWNALS